MAMINGSAGNDVLAGTQEDDTLSGYGGDDTLTGAEGNDTLDGGSGADSLNGGAGSDTYLVDNAADILTESAGQGTDLVQSSVSIILAEHIENLTLTGFGDLHATGNELGNVMVANSGINRLVGLGGNDYLDGGSGADILEGGTGNDSYVLDSSDLLIELASQGLDTVYSSFSFTLPDHVENLILDGFGGWSGMGNALDNLLTGNNASNFLDGGAGADAMAGGAGNDTYGVDNVGDTVTESLGQGVDTVLSSISWSLGGYLEHLTLTGMNNINGVGNGSANVLTGNSGNNRLTGGGGDDLIIGGGGNDTLNGGTGMDTAVYGANWISYTINSLAGVTTITGNGEADTLLGIEGLRFNGVSVSLADALNDGPGAADDNNSGDAVISSAVPGGGDAIATGNVLINDSDADLGLGLGETLAVSAIQGLSLVSGAAVIGIYGSLQIQADGGYVYTLNNGDPDTMSLVDGQTVTDLFSYTVADAHGASATASLAITIISSSGAGTSGNDTLSGTVRDDVLSGLGGNDVLYGMAGNDVLDGGAGGDLLVGGAGDDTYITDNSADRVQEGVNAGTDTVETSVTWTLGLHLENLALTGTAEINGYGNSLDNRMTGNSAGNTLKGLGGKDSLAGGAGDDRYYVDSADDVVTELTGEGNDYVYSTVSLKLGANLERLYLQEGFATALEAAGNSGDNILTGNSLGNVMRGNGGADTLSGRGGDDRYYVDSLDDVVEEYAAEGIDEVLASVSYVLRSNVENLTLTGSALSGTGNSLANNLKGNSANNLLNGGSGNDTLEGFSGADLLDGGSGADTLVGGLAGDTYVVDNTGDIVTELLNEGTDTVQAAISYTLGANVERLVLTGVTNISGVGNELTNTLTGNSGHNRLNGGAGADTLNGGVGNDTYVVETSGETLNEAVDAGTDTVETFLTWTLGANLENLTLNGSAAINGYGNSLNNVLTGNSGGNTLRGNGGADTLTGGAGDDRYYIDSTDDVVTELAAEGNDFIYSTVSLTLGEHLERLYLQEGYATALEAAGNSSNNHLTGNSLDNVLRGNGGVDTLRGRGGDDRYFVDGLDDLVEESAGEGKDEVISSAWIYILGANVENLTMDEAGRHGKGNAANNVLLGNSADNALYGLAGDDTLEGSAGMDMLDGGQGADTMAGGSDNDVCIVDDAGDVVTELTDQGNDAVWSSISYSLGSNIEGLVLTGTANTNGAGNALDNLLMGNQGSNILTGGLGNDTLDGGGGADTLQGGQGDDTYRVYGLDAGVVMVLESEAEGADTVLSYRDNYILGLNLENLVLAGAENLNGAGNDRANILTGNSGVNVLTGGLGNDIYTGSRGMGLDTVVENDSTAGNTDVLNFLTGIAHTQLWFTHVGNNLEVSIIGTNDKAVVKDWYLGAANRVEQVSTVDGGKVLQSTAVEALVTAMAGMTPPALGQTSLTIAQQAALEGVIAASWS